MRRTWAWGLLSAGIAILLGFTSAGVAQAATGDLLTSITAANPERCSVNVGLAFDGRDLLVPCVSGDGNGNTFIDYIDPIDGSLVKSLKVPLPGVAAVAYDTGRGKLWACDSPTGGNSPGSGTEAYLIDPTTGAATDEFPTAGCWDGLAYDAADDSLWVSPDQSNTIYHYTSGGTLINSFSGLTKGLGGYGNSGIAVGGADLYLSNADGGTIYTSPKDFSTAPAPTATEPGQHIEDMECDSVTFAPKDAMWVISAFDRTLNAYEIPAGSCGIGGKTVQHTLTVSKSGTGTGAVTSSPAGIDCGSTCSASFDSGTTVTLTATAEPGSTFAGWSGAGCSGTSTCQVSMGSDSNVVATFNQTPATSSPPTVSGGPPGTSAPVVSGGAPSTAGRTSATVSGTVNPENQVATAFFEYGLDQRFRGPGASTNLYDQSTAPQQIPASSTAQTVSASLSGLVPGALYHVRLVATNSSGTTRGQDQTFTTAKAAAPPPPVLGHSEDIAPVSGTVFIRTPSGAFVRLTGAQQIRSGAVIDALHGTLKITTALPGAQGARDAAAKGKRRKQKAKTQSGTFGGAVFKTTQARNGLATLSLLEGAFKGAPSYALCKAHKAADATIASTKTLQLLKASAHGKFRTRGRYSAATVRGTRWTVADRCDGTLTHVITDSVAVTDFVRHKTIVLHAGQSYLAKARKP